ncbi:MAG: hypothetical protein ACLR2K_04105 [Paraclostridium sordellii]
MPVKNTLDRISKVLYIIYAMFLIYPIKSLTNLGFLSTKIKLFNIIDNISSKDILYCLIIQGMILAVLYFGIQTSEKQINLCKDKNKLDKINKNLIPYKLFILITIIFSIVIIYVCKDKMLIFSSMLMLLTNIMIYYSKKLYFNEDFYYTKNITYSNDVDSICWRFKVWCDQIKKVEFKYRKVEIMLNMIYIKINILILIRSGFSIFKLIFVYFLVKNIFALIENIFNIFTSINGVCTDIQEHRTKHKIYYIVIVTDYINKREIRIKIDSNLFVNKGDNISVVHGIFSKQVVSMNLIKISRTEIGEIVFPMIFMFLLL